MTKTFTNTLAAALVAASAFGASAAFAGGDYYVGGSPDTVKSQNVEQVRTNSIGDRASAGSQSVPQAYDRGDYRPAGINN